MRVYSTTRTLNIPFILDAGASSANMKDPVVLRISRRGEGSQREQSERDQNIEMTRARRQKSLTHQEVTTHQRESLISAKTSAYCEHRYGSKEKLDFGK